MRKFLKKIVLIISISLFSISSVYFALFVFSSSLTELAKEVFFVIRKAKNNSGKYSVILGDSVCNQLWPQAKDSENVAHLGCNQAITPVGTYILLKEYLENNPQTREVYYIVRPQSLGNDMNRNYTYQYFVIPFMNDENIKLIDEETKHKIYEKFGEFFVKNGYIKNFLRSNNLFMAQYINYVKSQPEKNIYS